MAVCLVVLALVGCVAEQPEVPAEVVVAQTTPSLPATTATARLVSTLPPSFTPPPTLPAASATPAATATPQASATTSTTPSITPTATPTPHPFMPLDPALPTPVTAVPTPVPPFEKPEHITNVLLLGNDGEWRQGGRTDSMIIVSINRETKTATMLSIPRDLYVYIPGWKMERINLALPHGHGSDYPGGGGQLVKDTLLYNFGIEIDYYVRVGFNGFKQAVDILGGIEVAVSCSLRDWRLKEPDLDPAVEENWEQFELESGVHEMDGDLALWYVRSRRTTNDFDRGRRQQQVLRAMLQKGVDLDLLPRVPDLWNAYQDSVETDLPFTVMLQLAALAPDVRQNGIQNLYLSYGAVRPWQEPESKASVQLLDWEGAEPVLAALMQPPVLNRANRPPITVEVISDENYIMYRLAADNLAWHGFVPVYGTGDGIMPPTTEITYYGENFKGSFNWLLAWVMAQRVDNIALAGEGQTSEYDYRVEIGYDYDPCRPELEAPFREE